MEARRYTAELGDVGMFESMARYGDMRLHALVDLRRRFTAAEIERAVRATIADLPLLGCRYEPRFWRDRWVEVNAPIGDMVHVVEAPGDLEAETRGWLARPIDVTRERPWRVVSLGRGEGSRLIFSVTHVLTDGGGTAALAHVFGSHLYGLSPSLPVAQERSLRHALGGLRWYHLPLLARDVAGAVLQPLRTFTPGARERPYPARVAGDPCWRHMVIAAGELEAIRRRVGGASVNDLLVAAVARVASERSRRGPPTVMYTMDLRRYSGAPRLTVANTSTILAARIGREAAGDLRTATAAVARVTGRQKRSLEGPAFVVAPALLGATAPHALARRMVRALGPILVDGPLRRGLMITNVGRVDDGVRAFGNDIEDVRVVGPYIDSIPVPAIVAFGFRGALHLELFAAPCVAPSALDELEAELRRALELDSPIRRAHES